MSVKMIEAAIETAVYNDDHGHTECYNPELLAVFGTDHDGNKFVVIPGPNNEAIRYDIIDDGDGSPAKNTISLQQAFNLITEWYNRENN